MFTVSGVQSYCSLYFNRSPILSINLNNEQEWETKGKFLRMGIYPPQQIIIHHPAWKPHLHTYIFPFWELPVLWISGVCDHIMSETHLGIWQARGQCNLRPGSGTGSQRSQCRAAFLGGSWTRPVGSLEACACRDIESFRIESPDANAESTEQVRIVNGGELNGNWIESGSEERLLNDCLKTTLCIHCPNCECWADLFGQGGFVINRYKVMILKSLYD